MSGAGAEISGICPATGAGLALRLEGARIAALGAAEGVAEGAGYLAPGLIDLQLNGFGGHDLNSGALTPDTVSALCRRLLQEGVTRFLPTIITAAPEAMCDAMAAIARACAQDRIAQAMVAGIHVEGPALDPEDGPRGAHPAEHVRPPDLAEVARWQAASGGRVRMVTLSPHWPEAPGVIAALAAQGVHVALGHTGAGPAQIAAAVDAGATLSTHLGNGAAAMLPRHPNLIWAQLAEDRLTATLIADGHHLPAETLTVFLRAKGLERAVLVSDAAAPGGCAPGIYCQPIGAEVELSPEGRLSMRGTPYLAGAARSLSENVALAMRMAGLTLARALRLATANPARFAGDDDGAGGVLAGGARADLIRFDHTPGAGRLTIREVWLAGEKVVG